MSTTPAPTIMETPSPSSCGNASVELHHSGGGQFVQVTPQPNCEQHSDTLNDTIEQFDDELNDTGDMSTEDHANNNGDDDQNEELSPEEESLQLARALAAEEVEAIFCVRTFLSVQI